MAVLIPSLLPPPTPFKIFVLLVGRGGIGGGRFVTAIAIGRGIRYFGEGLLAVRYGDQAMAFLARARPDGRRSSWGRDCRGRCRPTCSSGEQTPRKADKMLRGNG